MATPLVPVGMLDSCGGEKTATGAWAHTSPITKTATTATEARWANLMTTIGKTAGSMIARSTYKCMLICGNLRRTVVTQAQCAVAIRTEGSAIPD